MSAVSRAESVVDINVRQACQLFAELRQVLGFLFAEPGVLEQDHVAVFHSGNSGFGVLAHNVVIVGKNNFLAQELAQADSHGSQAEFFFGAVFRFAQVAAQDQAAAVFDQFVQGGQSRDDAVVVGDLAVLHGDVEVTANQDSFALDIDVFHSFFVVRGHVCSSFPIHI